MIKITSKRDGFRRCGIAHSTAAVEYADDRFTEKELEILQSEPMLVVVLVDYQGSGEGAGKPNAKATIELLKAATSLEEFDKIMVGEERDSVVKAAANLRKKLEASA